MKVLQLCPLWYPIAHDAPGGIETLVARLMGALEQLGCQTTLIASGDSRVDARLVPVVPTNLSSQMQVGAAGEYVYYEQRQLQLALECAAEFDVIHSHLGPGAYVLSAVPGVGGRVLHTHHNPVYQDLEWYIREHPELPMTTVSEFQARKLWGQGATRCSAIHNGIEVEAFTFSPKAGDGLLFIGRMEPAKGPHLAVRVARRLQRPLVLAGPLLNGEYFAWEIQPLLDDQIRYVGVVDHREKDQLFGQAGCVVLPFECDEPFGLVAVEAMACGTPVVALARGAMPEIVEPGVTGYLTSDPEAMAPLVCRALELDRTAIRARVAERFDLRVTAARYRQVYEHMAGG